MSGVFSNLKPRNDVNRNGFDLSRRSVFSTKCGQILPVFCQATLPDSEYSIDVKQLLRTQPLQTAAFSGFSVNYDFIFVPNNYSYTSFNEFIAQRPDRKVATEPSYTHLPRFAFKYFMQALLIPAVWDYLMVSKFVPSADNTNITKPRFLYTSNHAPWQSLALSCIRSLDMFGYGNYLPLVKMCADSIWRDLEDYSSSTSHLDNTVFAFFWQNINAWLDFETYYDTAEQVWNVMNSAIIAISSESQFASLNPIDFPDVYPTLWPFMAYNKAFYEFYRNDYYDQSYGITINDLDSFGLDAYSPYYVSLFNFDDWKSDYIGQSYSHHDDECFIRLLCMMSLKPHQYKKDLFTGVLPGTQFGDVSVLLTDSDFHKLLVRNNEGQGISSHSAITVRQTSGSNSNLAEVTNSSAVYSQAGFRFDPALAISVLESRRADALQRFRERMLRAGNKTKDVFKSHGWNRPLSDASFDPIFLGSFDGRLDINTVASTAATENAELAQLGANGTAVVQGSKIHFKCHDFGTIIGVMYIVKDAEYDAFGMEKQHCLTDPFDYPYPELQNISLHPIDVLEVSSYLRFEPNNNLFHGIVLGYLPRFMEYKTALDKVHGEFYSSSIRPDEVNMSRWPSGVFSDWVTPRLDLNNPTSLAFLYQSPNIADNIFLVAANELQETDQFLVNCYFDVLAVEPVSVIGLPV